MEYKGMTVRQSKNGNIVVTGSNGELFIISNKGYLSDDKIKELVDKTVHFPENKE